MELSKNHFKKSKFSFLNKKKISNTFRIWIKHNFLN